MAETIEVSAIARVLDLASGPLKAIQAVITGVGGAAKAATTSFASMSRNVAGTAANMVGGLKGAGGQMAEFGKKMAGMFGPLQGLAGLAGLGGITAAVTSFISEARQLDAASQALGVTAATLEALQDAADSPEKATEGLTHLKTALTELGKGGKDAEHLVPLLHRMGVTAAEIKAGNLDAILPKIADSLQKNAGNALTAQVGIALFGDNWKQLLPLLSKGSAGLAEARQKMEELGISANLPQALAAGKAMDALGKSVTNAKNAVAAAVLPAFVPMVETVTAWVNANQDLLKQVALPAFIGLITTALISLGVALAGVLGPWGLLVAALAAGAVAIYQNWDKVKGFFDETLPGFLPALEEAGTGIASWAKQASADLTAGFQTGGIAGGLNAIWTTFKTLAEDTFNWVVNAFNAINWGDVGNKAWALIWAGLQAGFNSQVSLGQYLLDQFDAIDWNKLGQDILDGIASMYNNVSVLLDQLRNLNWQQVGSDIGTFLIDAMVAYFKAAVAIDVWLVQLVTKIGSAFANADWSAIGKALLHYFETLVTTIASIGYDLIVGLISGMWKAIPGLSAITDKITSSLKSAASTVGDWFTGSAEETTPGLPPPPARGPRLNPAAAARTDVNSNTNINISGLPPSASVTATSTTNGQPGGVAVGNNGAGVAVQ